MEVNSTSEGVRARVTVAGDVDSETSPQLESEFMRLTNAGATDIVLDVSDVSFLSSAGLSVLIAAQRDVQMFRVEPGNRIVDRLIALTGLSMLYGDTAGEQSVETAG